MRTENTVSGKITEAALYLYVIFFPISKALIEITFTVALLAWLTSKWEKREIPKLPWNAAAMFLYAFIVLSVLSVFVSGYPVQSLRGIGKFGEEILLFVMVYDTFRTREKLRRLMAVGFVVFLAILVDTLFQYAIGRDFFRRMDLSYVGTNIRLTGPFNNHALFAAFLIAWLSNALALCWGPSRLAKKERVFFFCWGCSACSTRRQEAPGFRWRRRWPFWRSSSGKNGFSPAWLLRRRWRSRCFLAT